MRDKHEGRRNIALTTLIDLLVQVVFVFTLLLLASDAIQGPPEGRGYVPTEAWRTLVSIFDADPKSDISLQAKEIVTKYQAVKVERDKARQEADAWRKKVDELDAIIEQLRAKAGGAAPGLPPCRDNQASDLIVLHADINENGEIAVTLLPSAKAVPMIVAETTEYSGKLMPRDDFRSAYDPWRVHGLVAQPKCKYTATVAYNPRASAGVFQPTIAAVYSIFRIQSIRRNDQLQ